MDAWADGVAAQADGPFAVVGASMCGYCALAIARRLARLQRPVWVRFVLVPGLTDAPGNYEQIASFAGSLGNVQRVDVLPFHQMGRFKWRQLDIPYTLEATGPPSDQLVDRVVAAFRAAGLDAC